MKIDKKNSIFLLGGQDLEMITIRKLLDKNNIEYKDKKLSWGAKLSEYRDVIEANPDKTFYAIELDIKNNELYKKYKEKIVIIDHHNEYSSNPTSLEQVIELLNIEKKLDKETKRYYKLVAANDRDYINGLKCAGATEEEIKEIRKEDRKAQGITKIDETRAKNDVCSRKEKHGIVTICATTDKFSAISDELYFDTKPNNPSRFIIYSDSKIVFYGFHVYKIIEKLRAEPYNINENNIYHGGGDYGYVGIKQGKIDDYSIKYIVDNLDNLETKMYSSHIFMFPFRFDYLGKKDDSANIEYSFYKNTSITERLKIEDLLKRLNHKDTKWKYRPFDLETVLKTKDYRYYNEFAYFYDYAREAIYNLKKFGEKDFFTHEISYYFEHRDFSSKKRGKNFYIINTGKNTYKLHIDGISLRIFSTGVAILSFELENYMHSSFKEIKEINEYGRRFYPQYLNTKDGCNPDFLAQCITITMPDTDIVENFPLENIAIKNQIRVGKHISEILGASIFTQEFKKEDKYYIKPIVDDRMFVLSWYGSNTVSEEIKNSYRFSNSWYEYVFVDKDDGCSVANLKMKTDLLKEATYDRWSHYKYGSTLFGLSRYSFVCLSGNTEFNRDVLPQPHMRTLYFQMITILLAIRTSILRFSDEVAAVATLKDQQEETRLQELYEDYLSFFNRLYFKELTHQDQGIELYDIGLKQMRINDHIQKLDSKFTKLFELANIKQSAREDESMNKLTIMGAIFLPPSIMIALFSMGIFDYNQSWQSLAIGLTAIIVSGFLGYCGIYESLNSSKLSCLKSIIKNFKKEWKDEK